MIGMKIGIFDSGSGGLTTLAAIRKELPEVEYYYIGDIDHHPYGDKSDAELQQITRTVVQKLVGWGAEMIVIACNTATTRCIRPLRATFPEVTFVGTEPALKVACDAGCQNILLLATTSTVNSAQVKRLEAANIHGQKLQLVPCPGLADLIERNVADLTEIKLRPGQIQPELELVDCERIKAKLQELLDSCIEIDKVDGVVLGCTHYILARKLVQEIFPQAKIVDGNAGVAKRVKALANQAA